MKGVKVFTIIMFTAMLIVPLALFNFKPDAVSEIDNSKLAPSPVGSSANKEVDFKDRLENYLSDRIGLRDKMILGYTVINDVVFRKMVNTPYIYGKDSEVFGAGITEEHKGSDEGYIALADMIQQMQEYCKHKKVPFLFVLDPSKAAVLTQKLPSSVKYDRSYVDKFLEELKKRGINYVDNTQTLIQTKDSGKAVFNKKYDVDSFNETGAYYSTLNALKKLKATSPKLHINEESEFDITTETKTSLTDIKYPINETIPVYTPKTPTKSIADKYSGLMLDSTFHSFDYVINDTRKSQGCPKALVFQGSGMFRYGHKFLENAFGECVQIHGYKNAANMPAYFNLFKPQCVIFELEDYAMTSNYFDFDSMKGIKFNPSYAKVKNAPKEDVAMSYGQLDIKKNEQFTEIIWKADERYEAAWLMMGKEFDLVKTKEGYSVIVPTAEREKFTGKLQIIAYKDGRRYNFT